MERKDIISEFNASVKIGLAECGIDIDSPELEYFGAAVSGGADSISLVTALNQILPQKKKLFAITINHNMRPQEETDADAKFTELYCQSIGVKCIRIEIPRGKIFDLAKQRNKGIEEAARVLRYEAFDFFCKQNNINYLCLAHNQNDQLETVLMRFIKGGDSQALSGIPSVRGIYIRPLINISRERIENYLAAQNISYCIDKTNSDTSMTRNCLRKKIIPLLNKEFPGWQDPVLSLSKKSHDDEELINEITNCSLKEIKWKIQEEDNNVESVQINFEAFGNLLPAIQRRILYKAVSIIGAEKRIPFQFINNICNISKKNTKEYLNISSSGIEFTLQNNILCIHKKSVIVTETGFFVIINEAGLYKVGCWNIDVKEDQNKISLLITNGLNESSNVTEVPGLKFPFIFRSKQPSDEIQNSDGTMRSVSRVIDSCLKGQQRNSVPIIQQAYDDQKIVCIAGNCLGFKDWIVRSDI